MREVVIITLILSFLILTLPVSAVKIDVSPSNNEIPAKEKLRYMIDIENDRIISDNFVITVLGPNLEWMNLDAYYIKLKPKERMEIGITFRPDEVGTYDYEVLVYSNRDNNIRDTDTFTLNVLPEKPVKLLAFGADLQQKEIEVYTEIMTNEKQTLDMYFEVMSSTGKRVGYMEFTEVVDGKSEITKTMELGNLDSDEYEIEMVIPDFGISAKTSFLVAPVHSIVTKKEVVSTPFSDDVIITVTNEGNVVEDYSVSESFQTNQYIDSDENPENVHLEEDGVVYSWAIEGMAIGATEKISYSVSRLPFLVGTLIVIFCVMALLGMGAVKIRSPNIKKKYIRKGSEHLVVLEVRGSLTRSLNNVLVKDRVSPLGKVKPEFEGPKPVVRESESGTELIWRLGDVKPRSEIYLTYRIKPLIHAEQLKMPRAHLTYRTDDERKINVFSKQILLE